ncbi:cupin domain-containing protein [Streptomyces sp. NBC_01613]|uniref:cupin domain-containing protein n=1 Tax=Streptomyces sp. NBC_01613 TaxID=2975896 RepID=UPI0038677E19
MHVATVGTTPLRRAPVPGGPTAEVLIAPGISDQVAVIHMEIPAGGRLPEHAHGASQVVLIPLSGSVDLHHGDDQHTLLLGSAAHLDTGERIGLANRGPVPASLMVVVSPPDFAAHLAAWPAL